MGAKNSVDTSVKSDENGGQRDFSKINAVSSKMSMPDYTAGTNNAFSSTESSDLALVIRKLSTANSDYDTESILNNLATSNDSVYTSIDNSHEMDALELDSLLSYDQATITDSTSLSKINHVFISAGVEFNGMISKKKRTSSYENFVLIEQNQNSARLDFKSSIRKAVRVEDYNSRNSNYCKTLLDRDSSNQKEFVIFNVMNIRKMRNDEKSYL
jgi:hypothetical protein